MAAHRVVAGPSDRDLAGALASAQTATWAAYVLLLVIGIVTQLRLLLAWWRLGWHFVTAG